MTQQHDARGHKCFVHILILIQLLDNIVPAARRCNAQVAIRRDHFSLRLEK